MSPALRISGSLLFPFFQLLAVRRFLYSFFRYPRRRRVRWAAWAAYYILTVAVQSADSIQLLALLAINAGLMFLVSACSFHSNLKNYCLFSILLSAVWMPEEVIVDLALSLVGLNEWEHAIVGPAISNLCMFVVAVMAGHYAKREEHPELSLQYMAAIILIPSGTIYLMHHIFCIVAERAEYSAFAIGSSFVLLLMNYTAFALYERIARNAGARERSLLYEQELELLTRQMKERENHDSQIRRLRHDMNNHLTGLLGMIEDGKEEQAKEYIRFLLKSSGEGRSGTVSRSGNPVVDAIVNDKYSQAQREGIAFEVNVFVPSELPFRAGDLAIVFGNLLDNALEACREPGLEKRWISLDASYRKEVLMVAVKNTCPGRKKNRNGNFFTTKKDRQNHGLGMSSVKQAVESYQGQLEAEYQDGMFQAVTVMYGNEGKNDI